MGIKLVVCDIDGTLFDKEENLPEFTREFVPMLAERGIPFTVATGRSPYMANRWIRQLGIRAPYVVNNGAQIAQDGLPLLTRSYGAGVIREELLQATELSMSVVLSRGTPEDTVLTRTPWTEKKERDFGIYGGVWMPGEAEWQALQLEKVVIIDKAFDVDRVHAPLLKYPHIDLIYYGKGGIEIMPRGCNKGQGVRDLARVMGVDMADVLAIGNDTNDQEMLREAGIGVAVANAYDDAKACADHVCAAPLAEGVREAIRRFCL